MTLKARLEKLEQASLQDDDLSKLVLWRSIVIRSGNGFTEIAHSEVILGRDTAPGMMERQPGESGQVFVCNVLQHAARIYNRSDEAFAEATRWHWGPQADGGACARPPVTS